MLKRQSIMYASIIHAVSRPTRKHEHLIRLETVVTDAICMNEAFISTILQSERDGVNKLFNTILEM